MNKYSKVKERESCRRRRRRRKKKKKKRRRKRRRRLFLSPYCPQPIIDGKKSVLGVK